MTPLPSYGMMPTTRKMATMALQNEPFSHHNEPHTNLNKAKKNRLSPKGGPSGAIWKHGCMWHS